MTDEIPVLEDGWTAREERRLLDLIATCGYGNWGDISRKMMKRSPDVKIFFYLFTSNYFF